MACRLFGPSHYLNQCWLIVNRTLRNKLQWNSNQNTKFFIHAFENVVCEMAAILSRGIWIILCQGSELDKHANPCNLVVVGFTLSCRLHKFRWSQRWERLVNVSLYAISGFSHLGGSDSFLCNECFEYISWIRRHHMMTSSNGNIFHVTGPLCGEFTGHRCIPLTKASDGDIWCVLWFAREQTLEYTTVRLVIWDTITLIMTTF